MSFSLVDIESAKKTAQNGAVAERMALAAREDIPPELLYYLAEDAAVEVRRLVAENPATPRQADLVLSRDPDPGVRCLLARKIVGTGLAADQRSQLWRMGFTILEALMRDRVVRVRRTLSRAIKAIAAAPHPVVLGLARDSDPRVAAPVLRHSPVLTDDDLVGLVEEGVPDWAQQAIAARDDVSERVCGALVDTGATPTVTRLLRNRRAGIGEPALERIVARAPDIEAWHEPLVRRPSLPARLVMAIGGFVSGPLKAILDARRNASGAVEEIAETKDGARKVESERVGWSPRAARADGSRETPGDRAWRLKNEGKLNDAVLELALNANEREFLMAALALRANVPLWGVERIVNSGSGRGITALCWKAGVPMRFAIEVQRRLARVPPSKVVHARDGIDYPFSSNEMEGRLELLLS